MTATGHYLPGPAVDNEQIESILGLVNGKPSRYKNKILKANGIKTRHYALDNQQQTTHSNSTLAVEAASECLRAATIPSQKVEMLSCATSQGDMVLPGFASMVQAGLGLSEIEINSAHGICSCSLMALKYAFNNLRVGDCNTALVVASELVSRHLKNTRYEAAGGSKVIDANAEFLRWMLSDGAGAVLLERQPRPRSLRLDWIRSFSHADAYPVCMSIGTPGTTEDNRSWQDFPTFAEAEAAGALLLRQDVRLLDNIVKAGVDGALRLIEEELLDVSKIDHLLCHYSSHHFRSPIFELLTQAGAAIPYEKWFTNLYERGNTGCASIFIMLDDFLQSDRCQPGETVVLMVPESGRFNTSYAQLTMV